MKITDEFLKEVGAKLRNKEKRIWELNCYYELHWARTNEIPKGNFWDVWELRSPQMPEFHGHFVDSVGELITFSYKDGYNDGRNSLRHDLKTLLNNKD